LVLKVVRVATADEAGGVHVGVDLPLESLVCQNIKWLWCICLPCCPSTQRMYRRWYRRWCSGRW
jgi:hypothetical protein